VPWSGRAETRPDKWAKCEDNILQRGTADAGFPRWCARIPGQVVCTCVVRSLTPCIPICVSASKPIILHATLTSHPKRSQVPETLSYSSKAE